MVRHEAAEALGALGDKGSLDILGEYRDKEGEEGVVKETCEIAVERIRWELEKQGVEVNVRKRYVSLQNSGCCIMMEESRGTNVEISI